MRFAASRVSPAQPHFFVGLSLHPQITVAWVPSVAIYYSELVTKTEQDEHGSSFYLLVVNVQLRGIGWPKTMKRDCPAGRPRKERIVSYRATSTLLAMRAPGWPCT